MIHEKISHGRYHVVLNVIQTSVRYKLLYMREIMSNIQECVPAAGDPEVATSMRGRQVAV